jgi:hypothetical protein
MVLPPHSDQIVVKVIFEPHSKRYRFSTPRCVARGARIGRCSPQIPLAQERLGGKSPRAQVAASSRPRPPALRLMPTLTRILPMATGMSRSRVPRALPFGCASSPLAVALGTPSTTPMGRPLPDGKKTWVRTIGILGTHGRGLPLRTRTIETPQSPRVLLPLQPAKMPPPLPGRPPPRPVATWIVPLPTSRLPSLLLAMPPPRRRWWICAARRYCARLVHRY